MSEKKDVKKGLKEFFEVLKSKPQTLEEAKQKTKNFYIMLGALFGLLAVIFVFISLFVTLLIVVAGVGSLGYLYFKENQKNKRNFCTECGAKVDYETCVSWEVTDVERKEISRNPNAQGKQVIQRDVATVEFTCTCGACGNEKKFSEKYTVTTWYDDGSRKDENLQTLTRNYFKI